MNCSDREKMLSDYLDGALNPAERQELEEHLETCAACRGVLETMKEAERLSREIVLADEPSPETWAARWPGMRKRILAETEKISRPQVSPFFSRTWWKPALAVAAGLLFLVGVGLIWKLTTLQSRIEELRLESEDTLAELNQAGEPNRGAEPPKRRYPGQGYPERPLLVPGHPAKFLPPRQVGND